MKGDDAHIRELTEEEFGRIFSRCRPMYVKIANSYIHDDGAAEDIVNECFIRMWERRSELKTENYEAYAFKSIVNRCLDHLRTLQTRTRIQKNMHEAGNRMQSYEISSLSSLNPESPTSPARCSSPAASTKRHTGKSLKLTGFRYVRLHPTSSLPCVPCEAP